MARQDLIDMKLNRVIKPMISDLKRNKKVIRRIGGHVVKTLGEEVRLQEARRDNLIWAQNATDEQIQQKIQELESQLTQDELACKYGSVRGLPLEKVKIIAMIEDLEIALGTHPGVK